MEEEQQIMDRLKEKERELEQNLLKIQDVTERRALIKSYLEWVEKNLTERPCIDFPSQFEWPNLESEPLSLDTHLRGRLTILDFFTYCCINCMHLLPDLESLEHEFSPQELLIIGVHSAKFENEKNSSNINDAAMRYEIKHPVVNDPHAALWKRLEIICWPTILVLDPHGKPIKFFIGEGKKESMREFLQVAVEKYRDLGLLTATSDSIPRLKSEFDATDVVDGRNRVLKYPGKLCTDNTGERIFISDSGHHRIVVVKSDCGEVETIVGDGIRGFRDGTLATSRFSSPQGLSFLSPNVLLICDTGNHAIRSINLDSGLVTTLAGNGSRGNDLEGGRVGPEQPLSSPWALCLGYSPEMLKSPEEKEIDALYIAMAGSHQIWCYALKDVAFWKGQQFQAKSCFRVAGNGAEENRNTSYPAKAAFAQPSGIAFDRQCGFLYIADSESSSVRSISLTENGTVKGVCGASKNPLDLFSFGDVDGKGCDAKLQHPLDVVVVRRDNDVNLVVADSYNHKLKIVRDLKAKNPECSTLRLDGDDAALNEPGGMALSPDGEKLYVCDTNNHEIKSVDLKTLETSRIKIFERFSSDDGDVLSCGGDVIRVEVDPSAVEAQILVKLLIPDGSKLNSDAPNSWTASISGNDWSFENGSKRGDILKPDFVIKMQREGKEMRREETLNLLFCIFLCKSDSGICYVVKKSANLVVLPTKNADARPCVLNLDLSN